jgi:hypothetical protein
MREKVRWPWWLIILVSGLDFSIVIAIWAGLGNDAAALGVVVTVALTIFFFLFTSLNISTDDETLTVGRAHIEKKFIGKSEILTRNQLTSVLREGFNPAAFHAVRFWIKTGVKIEIHDSRDPTPYWIVTCKKAAELDRWIKG